LCLEVAKLVQRRADALPQEPIAWDAWDDARPDAAADEAHRALRLPSAGDAERWVDRVQADRGRDGTFRRLELQAAPEAEPGALALCTLAEARFAERSCAAQEAQMQKQQEAQPDAAQ
jgi:hypothetical protein